MALFERIILKDTVEIETTPEKIWEFWVKMDNNYLDWHPESHISFQWIKGRPMEEGSTLYAEENVDGIVVKGKGTIVDVVKNRKFTLKPSFPRSLFCNYKYLIEPRGEKTAFSAFTYLKYPGFALKRILTELDSGKKHVREEGENLKRILEGRNR